MNTFLMGFMAQVNGMGVGWGLALCCFHIGSYLGPIKGYDICPVPPVVFSSSMGLDCASIWKVF